MRLLQIQLPLDGERRSALDLHPMMTIVSGLESAARDRLIDAVRALPAGRDAGYGGLVESHGVLFDLSAETLDLFGMHSDLDPVVSRSDLPGAAVTPAGPVGRLTPRQFLPDTPPGGHPQPHPPPKGPRPA